VLKKTEKKKPFLKKKFTHLNPDLGKRMLSARNRRRVATSLAVLPFLQATLIEQYSEKKWVTLITSHGE
jgi:hypothetical protein